MQITSPDFGHRGRIPSKYTCDGASTSPPLEFSGVPGNAVSLALIMDDPDAVVGTFIHWTLWNIDPSAGGVAENSVPAGAVQGMTSARDLRYHGPCPPSGTHRYFFKLYALDATLELPAGTSAAQLDAAMEGHTVDKAEFYGLYSRG